MLQKYRAYLIVIETGSITKAAQQLGYTQSAVSRMISQLEKEWGFPLLIRNRGSLVPPADGISLLSDLQIICDTQTSLTERIHRLHQAEEGYIRIGAFSSVSTSFLPQVLRGFQNAFPHFSFQLFHGEYEQIRSWIHQGIIDCGFLPLPVEKELEAFPVLQDRLVAVLPKHHPLAEQKSFPLAAFSEEVLIQLAEERDQEIRQIISLLPQKPHIIHTVSDDYAILAMAEAGLGISILHETVANPSKFHIATVPISPEHIRTIAITIKKNAPVSKSTKAFLSHISDWRIS